jgi:Na+/H+ antiporter NhaB
MMLGKVFMLKDCFKRLISAIILKIRAILIKTAPLWIFPAGILSAKCKTIHIVALENDVKKNYYGNYVRLSEGK